MTSIDLAEKYGGAKIGMIYATTKKSVKNEVQKQVLVVVNHCHAHGRNYYDLIRITVVNILGGQNIKRTVYA